MIARSYYSHHVQSGISASGRREYGELLPRESWGRVWATYKFRKYRTPWPGNRRILVTNGTYPAALI